jgi:hypothetical protein
MRVALIVFSLLAVGVWRRAEDVPPPRALVKVSEALDCAKPVSMEGWTRERVRPIDGSEGVLVDVWSSAGRRVKVSVVYQRSEAEAVESLKHLASGGAAKKIPGLADEAYSYGYADDIALRKGAVMAFVSAVSDIDSLVPALEREEGANLRRAEQVALNKNFARIMASILNDPSAPCRSGTRF